ncbi:bifunctional acetaldehyde-CoA/alcohol dehydrogenase [Amycolatopsis sp. lyj-90]|uniref:bifunctional acetaldehyde-CoA/alcohol dehydrogenase n=1 Tax=Amycolatopsis sp. lyj-90 TaxID=2789285 RepID=UPI00397DC047
MGTFRISWEDVAEFAEASGDVNPLHVDRRYARRTSFGAPVSHGALVVLHALGALPSRATPLPIVRLSARFHGAVFLDERYEVTVHLRSDTEIRLQVTGARQSMVDIVLELDPAGEFLSPAMIEGNRRTSAAERTLGDLDVGAFGVGYHVDPVSYQDTLRRSGAELTGITSAHAAMLGWASYAAGMEVPGTQSLISAMTVDLRNTDPGDSPSIEIRRLETRYRLIDFVAHLPGYGQACVKTVVRDRPRESRLEQVRALVAGADSLAGQVAVVVGGSRGLGASLVQALAILEAEVYLTFSQSQEEAERIKAELGPDGDRVRLIRCDAADPQANERLRAQLAEQHARVDILVLNAFPAFQPSPSDENATAAAMAYVEGALATVAVPLGCFGPVLEKGQGSVLLVSSAAVDNPPPGWDHYVAAKKRAESLLAGIVRERPLAGLVARPPRLCTGYAPGLTDTPGMDVEPVAAALVKRLPQITVGRVERIDHFGGVADAKREAAPEATLSVTATFTLDPLAVPLRSWCDRLGLSVEVELAPYAQVFQELLSPSSTLGRQSSGCGFVLIRFDDWPPEDTDRNLRDLAEAFRTFSARGGVRVVVQVCPSPSVTHHEDPRERRLAEALAGLPGVHFLGVDKWSGGLPVAEPHDPARLRLAHIPYTPEACVALATGVARSANSVLGAPFKVLVLDCDNTLWKGVAGEDGAHGVTVPEPQRRVQEWAVALRSRGVLLCLASKNDPETVAEVFRRRDDMPLRAEHITAQAVSWHAKSEGIRRMAEELNLGLDSIAFLDDNPIEVAEVRAACPEVLALTLPSSADAVPAFLDRIWAFDRLVVTNEDLGRAAAYQADRERGDLRSSGLNFADFIESLRLEVDIRPAADDDLARLAQMTQRTNQFNVSTIRRQEAELRALLAEPGVTCEVVRVSDRFGDYGIVGTAIQRVVEGAVVVDTLLLSCRALGRGVEHRIVAAVGAYARSLGLPVHIPFRETAKNLPARLFLEEITGKNGPDSSEEAVFILGSVEAAAVCFRPDAAESVTVKTKTSSAAPGAIHERPLGTLAHLAEELSSVTAISRWLHDGTRSEMGTGSGPPDDSALPVMVTILSDVLALPRTELTAETRFAGLGASSLAFVEAAVALEPHFGPVDLGAFYEYATLGDLAAVLGPPRKTGEVTADPPGPDLRSVVDELVRRGDKALGEFTTMSQEEVDAIVDRAAMAALGSHVELAELAVRETGRGVVEDRAVKNLFAIEHVSKSMSGLKTVGEVFRDDIAGIVEIAEPVGVICAVTPFTSPTAVVIFKALMALKTRNPIIFSFHHLCSESGVAAARIVRDEAVRAGAPEHCVQWMDLPSREATRTLMGHDGIAVILATGGDELVKAAYSSGTPAIGVGAGNVPALIRCDADIPRAVNDIVLSRTFDNGTSCAAEQTVLAERAIQDVVLHEFDLLHAYRLTPEEKRELELFLFGAEAGSPECATAVLNPASVGLGPVRLAGLAGFAVPEETSLLLATVDSIGEDEPLTRAKTCPVLAFLTVEDTEHGIDQAMRVVDLHGRGHTAVVHTRDERFATKFGNEVKAVRVVWNSPGAQGGMGDLYNAFLPSLTLGCGSYGGNSFSGNVSAVNLLNIRRIARRNNNIQWFKVPPKIYFEPNSLRYLADMPDVSRVSIVSGPTVAKLGHVEKVSRILRSRAEPVAIQVLDFIEPEPGVDTVARGAAMMREFQPDTIIALGGGSSLDAGKVMWLWYEHPDVDFDDMKERFHDIRKRVFTFPKLGERARLVCVPTTSGSGSEVTPFAVVTDKRTGTKYPLADYALTPSVAIVDPVLVGDLPAGIAADGGFDALTHATEAYLSVFANDYTDGLCLQAIRLIFGHLERSVQYGASDPEAREKMHNASTIAGMAFGNAFLGIVHAMAHTLGSTYGIAHGRTNAVLLPHVVRYNGTRPTKLTGWPKYESYQAPQRIQDIARMLGLPAGSPDEAVGSYADAIERLRDAVHLPKSFKEIGIDEAEFIGALPRQAVNAYKDQCAPANPRMPVLKDMEGLMRDAYYFGE